MQGFRTGRPLGWRRHASARDNLVPEAQDVLCVSFELFCWDALGGRPLVDVQTVVCLPFAPGEPVVATHILELTADSHARNGEGLGMPLRDFLGEFFHLRGFQCGAQFERVERHRQRCIRMLLYDSGGKAGCGSRGGSQKGRNL